MSEQNPYIMPAPEPIPAGSPPPKITAAVQRLLDKGREQAATVDET